MNKAGQNPKIHFEELDGRTFKIKLSGDIEDKRASLTHYLHNNQDNGDSHYKGDALDYVKRVLCVKYPEHIISSTIAESALQYLLFDTKLDVPFPSPAEPQFTFIDLFAGIGGFRIAFQRQQGKCVFSSEWNKFARKTYEANFGEMPFGDITEINENDIPDHDILLGGFPCQPFSIAGVSKKKSLGRNHGFLDETQGTLFFDIARIIKARKPKAFLLENVKNLVSHDKGKTFDVIIKTLDALGYSVRHQVIDAQHYVPQHRERIFIVGFRKDLVGNPRDFSFPEPPNHKPKFSEILEANPNSRYTITDNLWRYLRAYAKKHREKGNGFGYNLTDLNGVARTLSARYYKDGSEILIPQQEGENPRRLTMKECRRLMGYPETYRIEGIGVSDTQLYRQFGNSVVVPVVQAVAKSMVTYLIENGVFLGEENDTKRYPIRA